MDVKNIVDQIKTITKAGSLRTSKGWLVHCPVHADSTPSLHVWERNDRVYVHCFAGCDWRRVWDAVRSQTCMYNPDDVEIEYIDKPPWERPIRTTYDYRDAEGILRFQKVRFDDVEKGFSIRRPGRNGHWQWGKVRGLDIPYNLPLVISAKIVAIVEGEKDADTLTNRGIVATCNLDGASVGGKWPVAFNAYLKDKHILVFGDNDAPGIAQAHQIYNSLTDVRSKALMVPLPGLANKQDVTDWFTLGYDMDLLYDLWRERQESAI